MWLATLAQTGRHISHALWRASVGMQKFGCFLASEVPHMIRFGSTACKSMHSANDADMACHRCKVTPRASMWDGNNL